VRRIEMAGLPTPGQLCEMFDPQAPRWTQDAGREARA
jgi:hypothetical protein